MKITSALLFLTLCCAAAFGQKQGKTATIYGVITDSYCARDGHSDAMQLSKDMGKTAASCTLVCVHKGAKFVLLERGSGKVYTVADQMEAQKYAGLPVKIVGTIEKNRIIPSSVEAEENSGENGSPRRD